MSGSSLHHRRSSHALATVLAILFLTFLDNTIVSVTLANVQSSFHLGIVQLQWVVNGYMLAFAALMLTGGTLGDLLGRKKVMLAGVGIFTAGSVISLAAAGSTMLILGRVIMGIGAAASEPGTLSMIRHIYPESRERARAVGAWAAVCSVSLALGPIIGGVITGFWSWRGVFAFSTVLGLGGLAAGAAFLPESSDPKGRHLDIPGLIVGGLALVAASVGIIEGESVGYGTAWIIALLAGSVALGVAFVLIERKARDPVLKLEFFRDSAFSGANIVAFATNFSVFAVFFFAALYLQIMAGFTGFDLALGFVAMAGSMVISSIWSGRWISRHGARIPSAAGCILGGVGLLLVRAALHPGITTVMLAWTTAVMGLGLGMTLVATNTLVLSLVPPARSGMAASTVNTFRELGGVFGVSVLGSIMNARLISTLTKRLTQAEVPATFQKLIITAVTHGGGHLGKGSSASGVPPEFQELVKKAIQAAQEAFGRGLHAAFLVAAIVLLSAGALAAKVAHEPAPAKASSEAARKEESRKKLAA